MHYVSKTCAGLWLQLVTLEALQAVSERLRDVKRSVRREAASRLAATFRHSACLLCIILLHGSVFLLQSTLALVSGGHETNGR